ncbi:flp pilus-assembly TadE/G-like family protein [Corynebacterium aquatimens]
MLRNDRGYATILAAGIISAVVSVALVVVAAASHTVNSHRAQVAAELAAVSTATAVFALSGLPGSGEPCSVGRRTAEHNRADVTSCVLDGADATVAVKVGRATAVARAGPL